MDDTINEKADNNLLNTSLLRSVITVLFISYTAFNSVVLLYATILLSLINIMAVVVYYNFASKNKDSLHNFQRVKRQSMVQLVASFGFIALSLVIIIFS
jgi:archaellum biogenesis protein FlaJ (TadC family)